ncbi:hypothetical protein LG71_25735 [Pluralibacter gergoviae]|uniref:HofP DNA utilization family protein n=1 Tax=Pluralibacter gergoviae TaxID=61647 RepID=UPI000689E3BB|nr:HofP DNA utilization family protein [Pluralibacter gergoviae]AMR39170.1 hypothetical protein LG71_25735 [Pluralibacter gergoviae]
MKADRGLALLIVVLLPALAGMRDPFLPPEERCRLAELARWRYGGAAGAAGQLIGFMQAPDGRWHRLKTGEPLGSGRRVLAIAPDQLEIALDAQCEPSRWRWLKEGAKHEAYSAAGGDAVLQRDDSQRDAGEPGGG